MEQQNQNNFHQLKSKVASKKDIDFSHVIVLEDLSIDPKILKMHEERVNAIYKNLSDHDRQQQITNIIIRDNLFNRAMDFIVKHYEFEYDPEDIKILANTLAHQFPDAKDPKFTEMVAKRLIEKILIFSDFEKIYDIKINDEELINILKEYYEKTNKPIRQYMENEEAFQSAKQTLLEEKITSFIIEKFPRDLEKLRIKLIQMAEGANNPDANTNKENK